MATEIYPALNAPTWPATLAKFGTWIIVVGVLVAALSGPLTRLGVIKFTMGLSSLGIGLLVTVIGLLLGIVGFLVANAKGVSISKGATSLWIVVGLVLVGYLLSWLRTGMNVPPIHEISTDLDSPPAFVAVKAIRDAIPGLNPSDYVREQSGRGGAKMNVPDLQRKSYPDIQPLQLALPPDQAFARAEKAVKDMGFEVVASVPQEGRLEATATTLFFGFKDDVVIRLRAEGSGTRVDVSSKSRVGMGDAGTNAKRVRALLAKIQQG